MIKNGFHRQHIDDVRRHIAVVCIVWFCCKIRLQKMTHSDDALLLFKAAIYNLKSDADVCNIILDKLTLLKGSLCRLNRGDTLNIPSVHGTALDFVVKQNKKNLRFTLMIQDKKSGVKLSNSKIAPRWVKEYGIVKNKPLSAIGSGWQEILIKLHSVDHPLADDQGNAWFPLSCILSNELRDLSRGVLFEWLTSLFPLVEHRINTPASATAFIEQYWDQLNTDALGCIVEAIKTGAFGKGELFESEQPKIQKTVQHMQKAMFRNQVPRGEKKRKLSNVYSTDKKALHLATTNKSLPANLQHVFELVFN